MNIKKLIPIFLGAVCLSTVGARELPLPEIPAELTVPQERAGYLLTHFWDHADFSSHEEMADTAFMEQNFANFLSVMPHAAEQAQIRAFAALVDKTASASSEATDLVSYLADLYLYRPESPFYNEKLYIMYVEEMNRRLPEDFRMAALKEQLAKNAPGTKAFDLAFETTDGKERHLSEFSGQTVVLIFYDPDCDRCHSLAKALGSDSKVIRAISDGRLAIVAVYPDDDIELWRDHAGDFPTDWILGRDAAQSVNDDETYVLRSIPSVYLIAPDVTVILRDATAPAILEKIRQLGEV